MKRKQLIVLVCLGLCALALVACAPRGAAPAQAEHDGDETLVVAINWTPETECSVCHQSEHAAFLDGVGLAARHSAVRCVECHVDSSALEAVHAGVTTAHTLPTGLAKTSVSSETCLISSCHAASSWDGLAALTASSTAMADSNGTAVNPHAVAFSNADHTEANMVCTSCHRVHVDGQGYEAAKKYCYTCHHHKVFECGTCHTVSK